MKFNRITIYTAILLSILLVSRFAIAQVADPMINFTGKVTTTVGSEILDDNYDFVFSLYDTKAGGASIWTETLNAPSRFTATINNVTPVVSGVEYGFNLDSASTTLRLGQYLTNDTASGSVLITDFDLVAGTVTVASSSAWTMGDIIHNRPFVEGGIIDENLGSVNTLAGVNFGSQLYLEITFNGEVMQPRKTLTSVAHSMSTSQLGGKTESDFATLSENEIVTGEWTFNNIVDISTSSANTALTITQDGSGNILEVRKGASTSLAVLADGRVQIGEYVFPIADGSPGYVLKSDGFGNLSWQNDFAGTGGGSGLWASSSNSMFMYQSDAADIVVLGNNATSSIGIFQLEVTGESLFDGISLRNQNEIRLYDTGSTNYIGIRASSSMAGDIILTLPGGTGADGAALVTDGNGNLRWDAPSSFTFVNPGTTGQIPYYESNGSIVSATSSFSINPAGIFSVGSFSVNQAGEIVLGSWQGDIIDVAYGGTGTSTFEANSLLYAEADDDIGEILAGSEGAVLKIVSGVPTWGVDSTVGGESTLWATTTDNLAIMPTALNHVVLVGRMATTTQNSIMEVQGNAYFTANIDAQSLTLTNALAVSEGGTGSTSLSGILVGDGAGNIVSLVNNSTAWNAASTAYGSNGAGWDSASTAYTANGAGWNAAGTAYAANGANWDTAYGWGNHATYGYFSTSTDQVLDIVYGGTGTTTWAINSLVYANAANSLSQILPGSNGYALVMQGGIPTWASTSPGTSHDLLSTLHSDVTSDVVQRGDLMIGTSTPSVSWARMALGPDGYILRSDGLDMYWATTTGITELGNVTVGKWNADIIEVAYGGTGTSTWTAGSLVYATSTDVLGELYIGNNGNILQSVNGTPRWVSTSSLNMDLTGMVGTLPTASGGTGQNSSAWNGMVHVVGGVWSEVNGVANQVAYWSDNNTITSEAQLSASRGGTGVDHSLSTGFLYFDGGTSIASSSISTTWTDLTDDGSGVVLTGNILSLDTSGNWSGTFDNQQGSYYLNAINLNNFAVPFYTEFSGTTTDALAQGTTNLYWDNARFDTRFDGRLSATTTLPNITDLSSLNSVGTITSGTWNGNILDVAYGGTGTSTFEANSILFAVADDDVSEILAGTNGYSLKMVSGVPTWAPDLTVGGESQLWATSSDSLLVYPTDINKVVVVGAMTTTTAGYIFEVTGGDALFTGTIDAQDLSLVNALAVASGGTGSTTPSGILVGDGAGNIASLQNNSLAWNTTATAYGNDGAGWDSASAAYSSNGAGWNSASTAYATNGANWNTAVTWGNHSTYGYFSTTTDQVLDVTYGGTGTTTWEANSLVYADTDDHLSEVLAGSEGQVLVISGGSPAWSDTAAATQHPLLGAQHNDVIDAAVVRGDLMIGTSTPSTAWARLALGPDGYILRSNGTDLTWSTTTNITALGTVLVGRWEADVIDIAYGGTGASTATGARENLGLSEVHKFGIVSTGTAGYIWQSDGDGRGEWVATSSLGIGDGGGSISKFIGTTTVKYFPAFATSTLTGYQAANDICNSDYFGSHFCRTYDMIVTIEQDDISDWSGSTWIAEGPPGFTANANDCNGWTSSSTAMFGPFWALDSNGGGMAWLTSCQTQKTLACCSWQ